MSVSPNLAVTVGPQGGSAFRKATLGDKQICSIAESEARVNIWEGSIRSGKTFASILRFLTFVATAPRGGELVIVGKNRDSVYRNFFRPIEEAPGLEGFAASVHYRSGAPSAHILGREIHVIGANDAKAEAKLRGMTVAGAYVDEITVIAESFFKQLLGRMSVRGAKLFGTTNPDSPAHWLKTTYLDNLSKLPDWRRWHFTLEDNPGLSQEYIDSLKREYSGLWYKRFILGLWVAAEGAIFDMWDPEIHTIPWDDLPVMDELLAVGIDFGTTNATTALLLGISVEEQYGQPASRLYLIDEFRYDPSAQYSADGGMKQVDRLAPSELSRRIKKWDRGVHLPYKTSLRPKRRFIDPAATALRQELYTGVNPDTQKVDKYVTYLAENNVGYGLGKIASLLTEQQLVVARPTEKHPDKGCPGFITEAPGYSWDEKKTVEGIDEPVKVADHSLDGGRYAIASTEALWRHRVRWDKDIEAKMAA